MAVWRKRVEHFLLKRLLRHLRIAAGLRRGEEERQREQHRDECRPDERVLAYVWSLVAGIHYPSTILTLCRDKLSIENPGDEHHPLGGSL